MIGPNTIMIHPTYWGELSPVQRVYLHSHYNVHITDEVPRGMCYLTERGYPFVGPPEEELEI